MNSVGTVGGEVNSVEGDANSVKEDGRFVTDFLIWHKHSYFRASLALTGNAE